MCNINKIMEQTRVKTDKSFFYGTRKDWRLVQIKRD